MSDTGSGLFLFCGTDGLQAGRDQLPSGNLVSNEGGPPQLAVKRSAFWPEGKRIMVKFLNGSDKVKQNVQRHAQTWETYANIDFKFMADDDPSHADIRVAFAFRGDMGTYSYVGKEAEIAVVDQRLPTMNFGQLTENSRDEEFEHYVLHEFGHAIGCVHEHQANVIQWDEDEVYKGCWDRYKWDKKTTDQQILNLERIKDLTKTDFDANSIMCYWFPANWTKDKQCAPENFVLSDNDKAFINKMYPFRTHNEGRLEIVPGIRKDSDSVVLLNGKGIDFNPPYLKPPRVAVGLTKLEEANNANIRVKIAAQSVTRQGFLLNMDTWADSNMSNAAATWLEFKEDESDFQLGTYSTLDDRELGILPDPIQDASSGRITRRDVSKVAFASRYPKSKPPKVLTWLSGLDLGKEANWRISCYAEKITEKGFDLVIETWGDTICHSASATWVAYPADKDMVQSGKVSSLDERSWFPPKAKTSGSVDFAEGPLAFDKAPRVFIGLSTIDMDSAKKMRVEVYAKDINKDGFTWHGDSWGDSLLYTVGADWIAFG